MSRPLQNGHPRHVDSIWTLDLTPDGRGDAIVPRQNYEHADFSRIVLGEGKE